MRLIDSHSHLFLEEFAEDLPQVMARAREAGVTHIFMPNIDSTTIGPMLRVCREYKGYCYPMIGLHPTSVDADYEKELEIVARELASPNEFVAVGEIGMDLYWDKTFLREQQRVLDKQIEWALEYGLPVVLHCREAFDHIYNVLKPYQQTPLKGIFHSFTGTSEEACRIMEFADFMIGINGVVTFKKSTLPEVLKNIPLERIAADLANLNVTITRSANDGSLVVAGDQGSQPVNGNAAALNVSALASETDGYRLLTAKVGNGTAFTVRIMQATNLPTIYLTSTNANTQGRSYVDSSKRNTTTAALKMIDAAGSEISTMDIKELKARGNSTFTYAAKKSYQMKLETASDLLQNGENVKTWVLLANYFDATLMHDKLFKDMAAALEMPYTASCDWVNLYYDGEYRGVYLLSEKNAVKDTGINITDLEAAYKDQNPEYGTNMTTATGTNAYGGSYTYTTGLTDPTDITGGYLLELNHDAPDEVNGFVTKKGKGVNVKSPEWCGDAAMEYISEYYQAFENAVYAMDENGNYTGINDDGKHYYEYVDRDSLVKIFLLQELALSPDGFISSLYFYKDANGIITPWSSP